MGFELCFEIAVNYFEELWDWPWMVIRLSLCFGLWVVI